MEKPKRPAPIHTFPLFDFEWDEIKTYSEGLTFPERLIYLGYVRKEWLHLMERPRGEEVAEMWITHCHQFTLEKEDPNSELLKKLASELGKELERDPSQTELAELSKDLESAYFAELDWFLGPFLDQTHKMSDALNRVLAAPLLRAIDREIEYVKRCLKVAPPMPADKPSPKRNTEDVFKASVDACYRIYKCRHETGVPVKEDHLSVEEFAAEIRPPIGPLKREQWYVRAKGFTADEVRDAAYRKLSTEEDLDS